MQRDRRGGRGGDPEPAGGAGEAGTQTHAEEAGCGGRGGGEEDTPSRGLQADLQAEGAETAQAKAHPVPCGFRTSSLGLRAPVPTPGLALAGKQRGRWSGQRLELRPAPAMVAGP